MTVFSKKSFAITNPNSLNKEDREFRLPDQTFTHDLPEWLQDLPAFRRRVKDGDIIVMDTPKQIDTVLKKGTVGKRNGAHHEQGAADLGILDGGDAK
jgi:hypothetical protein